MTQRTVSAEDMEAAFERVWAVVRRWDISTDPGPYGLYEGINGDHVRAILAAAFDTSPPEEKRRPDMIITPFRKRETRKALLARMLEANRLVPAGRRIRHVRTGGEYLVYGHALRTDDLTPLAMYMPITGPAIFFSRPVAELRAKFVLADGEHWPVLPMVVRPPEDDRDEPT